MEPHVLAAGTSTTGWVVGYTIGIIIVLVLVALVVSILMLARSVGNEASKINDALTDAVHHGAAGRAPHHHRARHDHHRRPAARPGQAGRITMHHTLAMSSTEHNLWTIANILGIVVVVAVAALLSLLIYLVKIIDRRVVAVRDTLRAAAANTADTALIPQVATGVEAVLAEGLQHHLFLGRVLGKVKS
jgi:uncharacterized protein YybS (DUF2232 family)